MRTRPASIAPRRTSAALAALATLATLAATLLAAAAPAHAEFFAGEVADGPSADIVRVEDVDLARDGTGAVAYLRRDGGVEHVFVRRLVRGIAQPPERVDPGIAPASGAVSVAASDGGRLAVVFVSGGQTFATVRASARAAWTAPQQLGAGAGATSVDMSINGVAYAVFTAGGDLRAARLDRRATSFTVLGSPLDIDAAADAGAGTGRPRVALSADGTGLAVWAEAGHVWARRLVGLNVSPVPQDPGLPDLEGHAGGAADLPDVDIEDNSSYAWIVFRQQFADGAGTTGRGIARRLRGSRFEDPVVVDGLGWGGPSVDATDVDLSGRGEGLIATADGGGGARVAALRDDVFGPVTPVGAGLGVVPQPAVAMAERGMRVAAWLSDTRVQARHYEDDREVRTPPAPGPETTIADAALGAVDPAGGFDAASDRLGDVLIAFVQQGADGRRLVTASYDLEPGRPGARRSPSGWVLSARPLLRWRAARELWGPLAYEIEVDGAPYALTRSTRARPAKAIPDGVHRWRVVAVDRHGQATPGTSQTLRIDANAPVPTFSLRGRRLTVRVSDGRGSGVRSVHMAFGDGAMSSSRRASHTYAHGGTFTVRVRTVDRAGNVRTFKRRVAP